MTVQFVMKQISDEGDECKFDKNQTNTETLIDIDDECTFQIKLQTYEELWVSQATNTLTFTFREQPNNFLIIGNIF